jgi:hypothetical protein
MLNKNLLIKFIFLFLIYIYFFNFVSAEQSLLWQNIPWNEIENVYGPETTQKIKQMSESMPPTQIRELDRWTGAIHFEYQLPSKIPTNNANIWVVNPQTNQVFWSGPNQQPYGLNFITNNLWKYNQNLYNPYHYFNETNSRSQNFNNNYFNQNNINQTNINENNICGNNQPLFKILPDNILIQKNQNYQFKALYDPDGPNCPQPEQDKTNESEWQSLNLDIVSHINNGLFKGINQGTAGVKTKYQNSEAYATITVINAQNNDYNQNNDRNQQKPTVQTISATEISQNSARLNGKIYLNNNPAQYMFEYGVNQNALTNTTAWQPLNSQKTEVNVSLIISGLYPYTN